jgi:hypothetical protein
VVGRQLFLLSKFFGPSIVTRDNKYNGRIFQGWRVELGKTQLPTSFCRVYSFINSCDKILYNMPNRIQERCFSSIWELIYVQKFEGILILSRFTLISDNVNAYTFNYFIFNVIKLSLSYVFFWTKGSFLFKTNKI